MIDAAAASGVLRHPERYDQREIGGQVVLHEPKNIALELMAALGGKFQVGVRLRRTPERERDKGAATAVSLLTWAAGAGTAPTPLDHISDWSWVDAGVVALEPGLNELKVGSLTGFQISRLVLTPAKKGDASLLIPEEDDGGADLPALELLEADSAEAKLGRVDPRDRLAVSQRRFPAELWLEFAPVQPLALLAWAPATLDADGDSRSLFGSADDGESWLPIDDMAALPPALQQASPLRLRLYWKPAVDETAVAFRQGALNWRWDDSQSVAISGARLRLRFDRATGAVWDAWDRQTDRRLMLPLRRDLFVLSLTNGGKKLTLRSSDCTLVDLAAGDGTLKLVHEETKRGLRISTTLTAPKTSGERWRCVTEVANSGDARVVATRGLELSGLLSMSRYSLPSSLWNKRPGAHQFPGELSMGWAFVHGVECGVYLASEDSSMVGVELGAEVEQRLGRLWVRFLDPVEAGETREFPTAFALGSADWHWAADHYREWAQSWREEPTWPDWAQRTHGWWTLQTDTSAVLLDRRSTTVFEDARWMGLPFILSWVGCGDGEFVGRMPYLSPRLGTPAMSRRDSDRIKALGGHIGHYMQAREWRADFADAERIGYVPRTVFPADLKIEDRAWSKALAISQGGNLLIMCPAAGAWQAHQFRHAGDRGAVFGNDAIYLDQLGCTAMNCTATTHGHGGDYAVSGRGYRDMAAGILAKLRESQPDAVLVQEGMNALTSTVVQFQLISSMPSPDHGDMFQYTFPKSALVRGSSNGLYGNASTPLRDFMRDLYLFHRFEVPAYDQYVRDLVLLRDRVCDWQYGGRFMDDIGLTLPDGLRAKWFAYEQGGTRGIVLNWHDRQPATERTITLARDALPFMPRGDAYVYLDDGSVQRHTLTISPESIAIELPAAPVGSVMLPVALTAPDSIRLHAFQNWGGGPDRITVVAVNMGTEAAALTWKTELPDGVQLATESGQLRLPAGDVQQWDIAITRMPTAMADIGLYLQRGDASYRCSILVSPAMRNGDFELDEDANMHPDSWWNFSKTFAHIIHRLATDVDMFAYTAKRDESVKRSGQASLRLDGITPFRIDTATDWGPELGSEQPFTFRANQHLHLKPRTRYRLTAYAHAAIDGATCSLSAHGETATIRAMPPGEWSPLTVEFETGDSVVEPTVTLSNLSPAGHPVWFDDLTLEEQHRDD